MPRPKSARKSSDSSANLGFEAKLWLAADKLRNNMDAAEYKHVVLGLIFLKYISDTFEEQRTKLMEGEGEYAGANPLGSLIDRVHRELTDADLEIITDTYHAWREDGLPQSRGAAENKKESENLRASAPPREYSDIPGFCKSASTTDIAAHGHVLTPGRCVGAEAVEDDGEPFEQKMARLVAELHAQFAESATLEQAIKSNLRGLGYGG